MTSAMRSTGDEALLWLNDRLGRSVHVSVVRHRGDVDRDLLSAEGELRHWTETNPEVAGRWQSIGQPREDLAGLYKVGAAVLDLTNVREPVSITDEMLVVVVAEDEHGADHGELGLAGVTLEVIEQIRLLSSSDG